MYSASAIPQLAKAAMYQGLSPRFLRCAYQANVMNTFDIASNKTVLSTAGMRLYSFLASLTGTYTYYLLYRGNKNLAVTDLASPSALDNSLHRCLQQTIGND